jgi:hypothetical protein
MARAAEANGQAEVEVDQHGKPEAARYMKVNVLLDV